MHAGKAMTFSENDGKCKRHLQFAKKKANKITISVTLKKKGKQFLLIKKGHATNSISTWNFLVAESGNNISSLIF